MSNSPKKVLTLSIIYQHPRVLLGMKKRGFGAGRWNGFGGKVKANETIEQAARREVEEEAGVRPGDISLQGIIHFTFENDPKVLEVHIFRISELVGEPQETEEMKPKWFRTQEIPFKQIWPDDEVWFPLFLAGKAFRGTFHFDRPSDPEYAAKILKQDLQEVEPVMLEEPNVD